jgi:hypothetical protein
VLAVVDFSAAESLCDEQPPVKAFANLQAGAAVNRRPIDKPSLMNVPSVRRNLYCLGTISISRQQLNHRRY